MSQLLAEKFLNTSYHKRAENYLKKRELERKLEKIKAMKELIKGIDESGEKGLDEDKKKQLKNLRKQELLIELEIKKLK